MKKKNTQKNIINVEISILICFLLVIPSVYASVSIRRQEMTSEKSLINEKTTDIPVGLPVKTETRLLSSDQSGLYLVNTVVADDIIMTPINIDGDTYQKLVISDYSSTSEVGKPQLPMKTVMLAIPTEGDVSLSILDSFPIIKEGIRVSPVPGQVERKTPDGYTELEDVFTLDQTCYNTNMFYPGPLVDFTYGFIRDQRIINLNFHPVQYNPVTQDLQIHPLIQVQVKYSNPCSSISKDVGPYSTLCSQLLMNYNAPQRSLFNTASIPGPGVVSYPVDLASSTNSADYLIITSDAFYNPAQQDFNQGTQTNMLNKLAFWRSDYNGFDVAVVNVNDSFIGGNNDTYIKNFITYVYNNWQAPHMEDGHVGYILLVGDTPFVAPHYYMFAGEWGVCDFWYTCITDDVLPDIMIGRFSVDDYAELAAVADKTICYEQNPVLGDWQKKILVCSGSTDWGYDWDGHPNLNYDFNKEVLLKLGGWNVSEVFLKRGGTAADVYNNINDGRRIVVYCGHGYQFGWEFNDIAFFDVDQLHNDGKCPLVYSLACLTGTFQDDYNCMGEELLNTPSKGAVAFWGSSCITSCCSFLYHQFLFTSMFENFDYIVGQVTIAGVLRMCSAGNNLGYIMGYNLLGDPALDLSGSHGRLDREKPDLTLSHLNITLDPEHLTETTQVNITVSVHNIGGGNAENIPVRFLFEDMQGDQTIIGEQTLTGIIPSGGCGVVNQLCNVPENCIGKKYLVVKIDPDNLIDESYELNNQAGKVAFIYSDTTYVNDDNILGPWDGSLEHPYRCIRDGIDTVNPNGTVRVFSGVYHENIEIYSSLTLQGDGQANTIIDGGGIIDVIYLYVGSGSGVNISGFSIRNASKSSSYYGVIRGFSQVPVVIEGNTIEDGNNGIYISCPGNSIIRNNTIKNNNNGISTSMCYASIIGNIIVNNTYDGIYLSEASYNIIKDNFVMNNNRGIDLYHYSCHFCLPGSQGNQIYHNAFINNHQANAFCNIGGKSHNQWHNGYPSGGNYWSDFDQPSEGAWDNNADGIADRYYSIPGTSDRDNYPLMHFFGAAAINLNTSQMFATIQAAIDDQHTLSGHIILVSPGIHQENILLNKQIQLQGVNPLNTVLSGSQTSDVITISADGAVLTGFTIRDCGPSSVGVRIQSDNLIIYNNNITQNAVGILIEEQAINTKIYHNSFVNNGINAYDWGTNSWDNGYPSAGNYWSTYTGVDQYHGPGQNITGPDYIGDTPYNISGKTPPNQDHYPLMNPWVISLDSPIKPNHVNPVNSYPNDMNKGIGRIRWNVPGGIPQTFNTTSTNNNVYYKFYFGDGTDSGWVGPYSSGQFATVTHDFNNIGFFDVYAIAKVGTQVSIPSDTLTVQMFKLGDTNGDGRVTFADIDPFVIALKWGKDTYYASYPSGYWYTADCNVDQVVSFNDVDPFVALIGS